MKKAAVEELRNQPTQALEKTLEDEEKELVELRMQKAMGKLDDLHGVFKKRKKIAVIKTLLTERKENE